MIYFVRSARGVVLVTAYTKGRVENIPAHILRKLMEKYDSDATPSLDPDTAALLASIERGLQEASAGEGCVTTGARSKLI